MKSGATDGSKVFAKTELNSSQMIILTVEVEVPGQQRRISVKKLTEDFVWRHSHFVIDFEEALWNGDGMVGLSREHEICVSVQSRAGPVLGPFVGNQRKIRRDVEPG
jgi:hypothetical protein